MKDKKEAAAVVQAMRDVLPDRHPLHRRLDVLTRFDGELRRENQKLKSQLAAMEDENRNSISRSKEAIASMESLRLELEHEKALRQQAMTSIMQLEKEMAEIKQQRSQRLRVTDELVKECHHRKEILYLTAELCENIPGQPDTLVSFQSNDDEDDIRLAPMYDLDEVIGCIAPNVNKYLALGQFVTFLTRIIGYNCVVNNNPALHPGDFSVTTRTKIGALLKRLLNEDARNRGLNVDMGESGEEIHNISFPYPRG